MVFTALTSIFGLLKLQQSSAFEQASNSTLPGVVYLSFNLGELVLVLESQF